MTDRQQRVNEQIRITPIRVIAADGAQLGVIPTDQALQLARDSGLDLVEVAPTERPPVCRIMDFGKFKYQQQKRHKGHTHHTKLKEIRMRPGTDDHDVEVKVNNAKRFLQHKDKVQISVMFRGRERAHMEEGQHIIEHIVKSLEEFGKLEQSPMRQGYRITCVFAPKG